MPRGEDDEETAYVGEKKVLAHQQNFVVIIDSPIAHTALEAAALGGPRTGCTTTIPSSSC